MAGRTQTVLLFALAAAGGLYVLARRNPAATVDALEGAAVTVKKISAWILPSAGKQYAPLFAAATAKWNLPPNLLARQAYQESRFRPDIISGRTLSSAGAVGIMQIIPTWHPELDPGDAAADRAAALDPARAIDYAAKYDRALFNQFGSWPLALAAYNAGPGNVKKYGGVPPFPETQKYVAEISADVGLA